MPSNWTLYFLFILFLLKLISVIVCSMLDTHTPDVCSILFQRFVSRHRNLPCIAIFYSSNVLAIIRCCYNHRLFWLIDRIFTCTFFSGILLFTFCRQWDRIDGVIYSAIDWIHFQFDVSSYVTHFSNEYGVLEIGSNNLLSESMKLFDISTIVCVCYAWRMAFYFFEWVYVMW